VSKLKKIFDLSSLISNYFQHSVVRWEIGSFAKLGLWVGSCGFANVPMCGWLKLFFKMCGGKNF
jgi:hypothetical protein